LALTRCAWAYRALGVHCPELLAAICTEALNRLGDFATKALVKLADSLYASPNVEQFQALDKALAERMKNVADFIIEHFPDANSLSLDKTQYINQLGSMGVVDCGSCGTPYLLAHFDIQLPDRDFILKCRMRAWEDEEEDRCLFRPEDYQEAAVAQCNFTFEERTQHRWLLRTNTNAPREATEEPKDLFTVVDISLQTPQEVSTYKVLIEACSVIADMGVDLYALEACACVTGWIKMIAYQIPCLSSVAILWQFRTLFPGVRVELADQARDSGGAWLRH